MSLEPRSDRSLVVPAIFGLVVTSTGLGSWATVDRPDQPARYPGYHESAQQEQRPTAALTFPQDVQRTEERRPCQDQRSRDESELCAQWSAAQAGRDAADWSLWQFIVSIAGVIGLGITLWFNWRALERAREANDLARELGERQVRAYLSATAIYFDTDQAGRNSIVIRVSNMGQSPASGVHLICQIYHYYTTKESIDLTNIIADWKIETDVVDLGAGADEELSFRIYPPVRSAVAFQAELTLSYKTVFSEGGVIEIAKRHGMIVSQNPPAIPSRIPAGSVLVGV